jgi:DNA-binding response OmpR family regulator
MDAEGELAALAGRTVHPKVTFPDAINAALDQVYSEDSPQVQETPQAIPEDRDGPHVLVVDDDDDARALLRNALEGRGFRVSEASDGGEALVALDRNDDTVHLVTLDLQMRELHGLDTLRKMRRTLGTAHIPVIIATGSDDPRVEMDLFAAGADDYVVKPIDPPRFVLRVQAVLRRRGGVGPAISL